MSDEKTAAPPGLGVFMMGVFLLLLQMGVLFAVALMYETVPRGAVLMALMGMVIGLLFMLSGVRAGKRGRR